MGVFTMRVNAGVGTKGHVEVHLYGTLEAFVRQRQDVLSLELESKLLWLRTRGFSKGLIYLRNL
jgi:hypothetical protein